MQFAPYRAEKPEKYENMKKKEVYNEAVSGDEGFSAGDGYPSCDGEPCANVADDAEDATATMAVGGETSEPEAAVELEAVVAEWQDKYLRLQAEFDNYRKRTLREKMDLVQTGGRDVLLAMLPVRDDVQRALAAMEKSDDVEALRQKGVTEIEVKDKDFDAEYCEAVARFAAGEEKKGKVIDVVQTGYMLGERVLRFAKVVVGE